MLEKKNEFDFLQQVRFRRSFVFSWWLISLIT
jgi:hypothetical protein